MTSLRRKFQRAKHGAKAFKKSRNNERPFRSAPDGSYSTLRPTKGWLRVSIKRLMIEPLMAHLLGGK
jgi:hypothetical protein